MRVRHISTSCVTRLLPVSLIRLRLPDTCNDIHDPLFAGELGDRRGFPARYGIRTSVPGSLAVRGYVAPRV